MVAIEKDEEMVKEGRKKLENSRVPVELIESDVLAGKVWESLGKFNTVFCNFSIHYLAGTRSKNSTTAYF